MPTSTEIRQQFLDFFKSKQHEIVRSAPVVPQDDPTLMFTNAGMNQFKDVFLGQGTRPYTRVADTQKCIRVSGKHNDLEEVGRDGYHHTFFEMLGNWSFGDYYKKEACAWAWELLTDVWGLDKDRLYITVFEDDDETAQIWQEITGFTEESGKIQRHDAKDNFWEMGEVGPCGPCSELHYDRTPDKSGKDLVNADHEDVIEIWNLVFIQYNRKKDRSLEDLPAKHVDTGMGFERIVSVIQGKTTNYDTDVFQPTLQAIGELSGVPYESGDAGIPHQVIADHIRMVSFSIADGAKPDNEGRGYVIRRILRRAARFGRKLGLDEPFMYKLVNVLKEQYDEAFPELAAQSEFIAQVVKAEESSFNRNLDRGMKLFNELTRTLDDGGQIPGKAAFTLYDTYGFPIDMTEQMAEERGLTVDMLAYAEELEAAKKRSQGQTTTVTSDWIIFRDIATEPFLGYDMHTCETDISRYRATGEKDSQGNAIYQIILEQTPFYAESGGQVGDTGMLECDDFSVRVFDTKKIDGQNVCLGIVTVGEIADCPVSATVDHSRLSCIKRNHTATHLLHQALKDVLGDHVQQKGSLVTPDSLRFDFSHFQGVTDEELKKVERIVNTQVLEDAALDTMFKEIDEARAMGAQALFGEKYGDVVRVVQIGNYSLELCGGIHVERSGEIGLVKITSESSISAGVRRLEAVTGESAYRLADESFTRINVIASMLKCTPADVVARVEQNMARMKEFEKETAQLKEKLAAADAGDMLSDVEEYKGVKILAKQVSVGDVESLKNLAHTLREKLGSGICTLGADINGKAMLVVTATDDLVEKGIKSGAIIGPVARIVGGGGGGHPRFAQAGGKNPEKLGEAMEAAPAIIKEQLDALNTDK